jgi:hypothetical protein
MAANGISTLSTKALKQVAKLDLAKTKRRGTTQAGSLVFSGSAQLDMSAAANTNLGDSTAFTIEVWVYVTAYIPAANGILIQQGGQKNVNYATHQLSLANDTITFNTGTGAGGANTGGKTVNSSTPLPLSTWTHIAVVWDGTNIKLYQGGVLVGTTAATPLQMGTNSANLTIGNISGGGANDYFTGRLYGIRIVKNVAVYTGAFTVPTSPLTPTQSSGTNITAITGTATGLLLNAATSATYLTDSSSYAATVSNSSVTWSASGPALTNTSANFYRTRNNYDITQLPTQYSGDNIIDNLNGGGLVAGRPWVIFLPSDLFAASEKGIWYDPSDITTLFQDVAGTIPITASGQTVALMKDKSGNGINATQSSASSRPTFLIYPGTEYGYLYFDGVNDFMVTGSLTFAATSVSTITATVGVQVDTGASGARIVLELGTDTSASNGSFYITAPSTAGDHSFGLRGTTFIAGVVANVDPSDDILTAQLNIGAATKELELIPRLNGVTKSGAGITWSGAANAGTGTFGTKAMYIGARAGTSLFFKGKFYGAVIRGATSTAPQITDTEAWTTSKLY